MPTRTTPKADPKNVTIPVKGEDLVLEELLELHEAWLSGDPDGSPLYLRSADLRGVDLSKRALTRAVFSDCNLNGADLSGSTLDRACFDGAALHDSILNEAHADNADFSNATLIGAYCRAFVGNFASFHAAKLWRADFHAAILGGARLTAANAARADFSWADLKDAILNRANCTLTDFTHASLVGVSTTGTQFDRTCFLDVILPSLPALLDASWPSISADTRDALDRHARAFSYVDIDGIGWTPRLLVKRIIEEGCVEFAGQGE